MLIDADSHVLEPPDVWQRYVEPRFRERAVRVVRDADGRDVLLVDGRPARLTTPEMLGDFGGMGRSLEEQATAALSGRYADNAPAAATDPRARIAQLDREGVAATILYPSLGLQWVAETTDAGYVHANLQAYNRWLEEICAGSGGRLVPVAHLSLGDARAAAAELERAVASGARGGFLLPYTLDGLPHGHPAHDPLFAKAQELDVPIGIHTGVDPT
ncbi:MAG: amidohydrolase family protein, partial [Thermodesulfobacteriota bacterium]